MPFDSPAVWARRSSRNGLVNQGHSDRLRASDFSMQERWRYLVRGQVQGVGFRTACSAMARELGLSGWVRNCSDGSVEVQAEGSEQQLIALRVWCENGPPGARVASLLASRVAATGADWFEIRADLRRSQPVVNPRARSAP